MELIVGMPDVQLEGFITPGHVAAILGTKPFRIFSDAYRYPNVVAGFEPNDLLLSIYMLIEQIYQKKSETLNEYTRVVKPEGNQKALNILADAIQRALLMPLVRDIVSL